MPPPNKKRGLGFSQNKLTCLLDALEEFLPIGGDEWDMVERNHAKYYPENKRTKESLRRKFSNLYLTRLPTGDPNCPPDVRRAKYIHEEIKKRSGLSDGEGEDGEEEGEEEDNNQESVSADEVSDYDRPGEKEPADDAEDDAGGGEEMKQGPDEPLPAVINFQQMCKSNRTKRSSGSISSSTSMMTSSKAKKIRVGGGSGDASMASVVASIDSVVKLMLVTRESDVEDRKKEAKMREEERAKEAKMREEERAIEARIRQEERANDARIRQEDRSFMQQMILIMTMGQQQPQPNQIANMVGNMTMLSSSNNISNDIVELVDHNETKDNKE